MSQDGTETVPRPGPIVYIRPQGELLMRAWDVFGDLHQQALSARFDTRSLRLGRQTINDLLRLAEQESN